MKLVNRVCLLIIYLKYRCNCFITEEIHLPELGSVVGKVEKKLDGVSYEAFYGIPFGEPPIGSKRFSNFEPIKPWNSLLKTMKPKSKCIQKNIFYGKNAPITGKEDCLYMNIYRPRKLSKKVHLPVLVLIHGGGFFSGSSHPDKYGPEKLMKTEKIILVTFQYRLGIFGFLSTNDSAAEGNQSFKDQTGALKFIKKYIKHFNGNTNMITLLGHGASAASIHMHMMSRQSKGLFNRVIMLSGSGIAPYNEPTSDPAKQVYKLADYVGLSNALMLSTHELIEKLKQIDAVKLVQAVDNFHTNGIDPVVVFKIVIEDPTNEHAFITEHPKVISNCGNLYYVPVLTGILENDGSVRTFTIIKNKTEILRFNEDFNDNFAVLLDIDKKQDNLNKIVDHFMNSQHQLNEKSFIGFQKVVSDRAFIYPFYNTIKDLVKYSDKPIILYKYDRVAGARLNSNIVGPIHGDDIVEIFTSKKNFKKSSEVKGKQNSSEFFNFIVKFTTSYTIEHSTTCTLELLNIKLEENKFCPYTYFGNSVKIDDSFRINDMKFWDNMFV